MRKGKGQCSPTTCAGVWDRYASSLSGSRDLHHRVDNFLCVEYCAFRKRLR